MVGEVINVGDPKGLNGHTAYAEEELPCEHDPHHS